MIPAEYDLGVQNNNAWTLLFLPVLAGVIGSIVLEPLLYRSAGRGRVKTKLRRAVTATSIFIVMAVAPAVLLVLTLAGIAGAAGLVLLAAFSPFSSTSWPLSCSP